jgi:hypothetical protein
MSVLKPKTWNFLSIAAPGLIVLAATAWFIYELRYGPCAPFRSDARAAAPAPVAVAPSADDHVVDCAERLLVAPNASLRDAAAAQPDCADVYEWLIPAIEAQEVR